MSIVKGNNCLPMIRLFPFICFLMQSQNCDVLCLIHCLALGHVIFIIKLVFVCCKSFFVKIVICVFSYKFMTLQITILIVNMKPFGYYQHPRNIFFTIPNFQLQLCKLSNTSYFKYKHLLSWFLYVWSINNFCLLRHSIDSIFHHFQLLKDY